MAIGSFRRAILLVAVLTAVVAALPACAGDRGLPREIDPAKRYLFYMHGTYVERHGADGKYQIYPILDALAAEGFVVIGEARAKDTDERDYAGRVARDVRTLLDAGVPARNITVAGHSKGGFITMVVAVKVGRPDVSYGVLAGCGLRGTRFGKGYKRFVSNNAQDLKGRFLVMWAKDDDITGDCDAAMQRAGLAQRNVVLPAGKGGHQVFYKPDALWMTVLSGFARGE